MITFNEVSKTFEDGYEAIKNLSFEVEAGELLVLIGPSGCGKTTTMKMINRLIEPTSGTITIDGKNIAEESPVALRRNIGYVIQQIGLLPHMTIRENVSLVPRLKKWDKKRYQNKVSELMEMVGLDPETFGDRYPSELSGGQQQRIGVIRALAGEPNIILMDEPFSALDPISREQLQDELSRLQRTIRKTIVFVTHDMDEALKIADRICLMKDGEIVQLDHPEKILRHPANDFVRQFIGEERMNGHVVMPGLQKLMVTPVTAHYMRGLAEALKFMRKKRVDSLLVVDDDDTFLGIATIWDVQKRFREEGLTLNDIAKTDVPTVFDNETAEEAMKHVNNSLYGFVPVIDEKRRLCGIVNRASLVEYIVDQFVQ